MTMPANIMFGLVLLGISQISAASDDERKAMMQQLHNSCVAETGVDEKTITDCSKGIFAEDEKLKCYMKCLLVTVSIMDEETGEWDFDTAEAIIPDEYKKVAVPILHECGAVKGGNNCETAFLTNKCWQSKAPEIYHLI